MKGKHVFTNFAAVVVGLRKQQPGVWFLNLVLVSLIFKVRVKQALAHSPL